MERLPDEVVLLVLRYVGVDDLFTCRLVCKRLGGLALHPGVWRYRSSFNSSRPEYSENVCRLLRLAPRLDYLSVDFPPKNDVHLSLYATTRCAVRQLMTHVSNAGGVHAALFVRNQEALGQLRVITLWLMDERGPNDAVLLGTVASTSILEKLTVRCDGWNSGLSEAILHTTIAQPSLKYFECSLSSKSQPFVDLVLAGHAASLEEVWLGYTTTSLGSLPECMPKLRVLTCPLLPGMETLAPSLTKVTLYVTPDMRQGVLGATEMLRRASKLRELTLKYRPAARTSAYVGVDLVEALAWSGRSAVEVLEIDNNFFKELDGGDSDDGGIEFLPQLQPLVRALPSLPALRHLELSVYVPPDELLLAITPETVPALRDLRLSPMRWLPARCAHDWRHKDSVQTLLSVNPALKFSVLTRPYCLKGQRQFCGSCAQGCHNTLWEWDWEVEFDKLKYKYKYMDWVHIR